MAIASAEPPAAMMMAAQSTRPAAIKPRKADVTRGSFSDFVMWFDIADVRVNGKTNEAHWLRVPAMKVALGLLHT